MAENDAQERSQEATPKRLEDARRKGQVARSRELATLAMMATAIGAIAIFGAASVESLMSVMASSFSPDIRPLGLELLSFLGEKLIEVMIGNAPILGTMGVIALLATISIGGWVFSGEAVRFNWEKLDPIKGLGRIFSITTLVELLKAGMKFVLVGGISAAWMWFNADAFIELDSTSVVMATDKYTSLLAAMGLVMLVPLALIAAIDAPYQLWNHARQLRMTLRELKDEMKDTEGNPEVKAKVRRRQQEVAQKRMLNDVPDATVVITNPSHFAVALRYDASRMRAPVVSAKGVDTVALRIRTIAQAHRVPLVEAPPLARALFHNVDLGGPIPEALYLAVARVLAFVQELRRSGVRQRRPSRLRNIGVPPEFEVSPQ